MNLSDQEIRAIIDYARRKFSEERYPLDPALKPIREALAKLDQKPLPETSTATRKKRR